jgi:hypothetical protein
MENQNSNVRDLISLPAQDRTYPQMLPKQVSKDNHLHVDDYHLLGDDAVWLISQKMIIIIVTAVETSNLTSTCCLDAQQLYFCTI